MEPVHPQVSSDLQELEARIQKLAAAVYELGDAVETIVRNDPSNGLAASQASSAKMKASNLR